MRDILFSAKRIDNGYTVCGYHVKDGVTGKHFIVAEGSMLHESDKVGEEGLLNFVAFEVDEDTISLTGDGWIPVDERLPEEKQSVLVQWEKYDRHLDVTLTYLDVMWLDDAEEGIFETINGVPNGKVIAWQPLPEPYHPERSDNHDE